MKYRTDPKSGNQLSVLGFGCMRFPRGINAKIDIDKTEKLIMSAIAGGVDYFDTGYIYGGSEQALGEVFGRNKGVRGKIYIATKLPVAKCKDGGDFDRIFNTQLERLNTGYIDYYLMHNLSSARQWDSLCEMGIREWIAKKKAEGSLRRIGFSFHGAQNEFLILIDAYEWDFCQIQYNYMNENYQAGKKGLLKAYEKGMPVIIMEPLLGGKLAAGLPKKAVKFIKNSGVGLTPAALALRWIWNQKETTVVLSGMSAPEQLSENIAAAETAEADMLTETETELVERVAAVIKGAYKIPCTGCNYCQPCSHGVNISGCFAGYNALFSSGYITGMAQYVTSTGATNPGKNQGARNCVKCGKCERLCPQNIKIIKSLEAVSRRMEPVWYNAAIKLIGRILN